MNGSCEEEPSAGHDGEEEPSAISSIYFVICGRRPSRKGEEDPSAIVLKTCGRRPSRKGEEHPSAISCMHVSERSCEEEPSAGRAGEEGPSAPHLL